LGLLISGVFVGLAYLSLSSRGVTFAEIFDRLGAGNYAWVGVYIAMQLLLAGVRVIRWGILIRGFSPIPWRRITGIALVGQMAIGLLPMRLGEAARPVLILERGRINLGQSTATVVVERVFDGILIGLMFGSTLYFLRHMDLPFEFLIGAYLTTAVFGGMAIVLLAATIFRQGAVRFLNLILRPISTRVASRLVALLESFLEALKTIALDPRRGAAFVALSVVHWLITGVTLVPIFIAFGIDLPVVASFAVLCVMMVGYMIPAGPAATGTLNYAIILALDAFGVVESTTGALAILLYGLILMVNVAVGLAGLWLGGASLGSILSLGAQPTADLDAVSEGDERGEGGE
jgi:uncharacterized protein (TIRG00374 family)